VVTTAGHYPAVELIGQKVEWRVVQSSAYTPHLKKKMSFLWKKLDFFYKKRREKHEMPFFYWTIRFELSIILLIDYRKFDI
jgi:hypothetical protein